MCHWTVLNWWCGSSQNSRIPCEVKNSHTSPRDKLPDIPAELVRLDDNWQEWGFPEVIETLRKWCDRNAIPSRDQMRSTPDNDHSHRDPSIGSPPKRDLPSYPWLVDLVSIKSSPLKPLSTKETSCLPNQGWKCKGGTCLCLLQWWRSSLCRV